MTERERLTAEVAAAKVRLQTWNDMVSSSYQHWQKCYAERNHADQMLNTLTAGLAALPPEPKLEPAPKPCPRVVGMRYWITREGDERQPYALMWATQDDVFMVHLHDMVRLTDPVLVADPYHHHITDAEWTRITRGRKCESQG